MSAPAAAWERPTTLWPAYLALAERVVAFLALAALSPLLLAIAAAVLILSGQSPLVAVRRAGWRNEILRILKFRTMWPTRGAKLKWALVEYIDEPVVTLVKGDHDPRVTSAFAGFCRRYSLDELPQVGHVLSGRMSFVGPRPLTISELAEHYGSDADEILAAKPGITGLWQVRGRNRLSYAQRKRLDLFLVRHCTLNLYLYILYRTMPCVVSGRDAW